MRPLQHICRDVAIDVLERSAFLCCRADKLHSGRLTGPVATVMRMQHGSDHIKVRVAADPAFGARLTANLLGKNSDEPPTTAEINDALCEVTNMICGILAEIVFGSHAVVQLGIPEVQQLKGEASHYAQNALRLSFVSDNGSTMSMEAVCEIAASAEKK